MKRKVLVVAHDPGGANAVAVTAANLRESEFVVDAYAIGPAQRQYERLGVEYLALEDVRILKGDLPSYDLLLVGTSAEDRSEIILLEMARQFSVPSLAVLDYWANYKARFMLDLQDVDSVVLPDVITALDQHCAVEMVEEGLPKERIVISGQPYFGWLCRHDVRSGSVLESAKRVLFASQPHPAASEVLETLINVLAENRNFQELLVRFHPRQTDIADSVALLEASGLCYHIDSSPDVLTTLKSCDRVIGLSSVILIESALMGVPACSFLPRPWENTLKTNGYGLTIPVTTGEELNAFLTGAPEKWKREEFCRMQQDSEKKIVDLCRTLCSG